MDIPDDNSLDLPVEANMAASEAPGPTTQGTSPSQENNSQGAAPTISASEPQGRETAFLLILKNGTRRTVADYWFADGYIEYVSPDGIRSHIPIESLEFEKTALENANRGLRFVVRSAPAVTQ